MTYLEAVNQVLLRLREDTVSTVSETSYSSLIGEMIKDAKEIVDNAWDWTQYTRSQIFSPNAGTYELYVINGSENGSIHSLYNATTKNFLEYRDLDWFITKLYGVDEVTTGSPTYWTTNASAGVSGDPQIMIYPVPDKTYTIIANISKKDNELISDLSTINVPWRPVVHYAVALATRERGETGGTSSQELFAIADQYLSDAIAYDANRTPEKLVYRAV